MRTLSIILQILAYIFAGKAALLAFVSPGAFRGIAGWINKILGRVGLSGSGDAVKRREKLVYCLIGLAVLCGLIGLILEFFIK